MSTIWTRNGAYIAALRPAAGDLVVMTTLDGRVAALDPVGDYDGAISRALTLAGKHRRSAVKVLTMTLVEAVTFCGIGFDAFTADISDAELRERTVAACLPMLDHPNPRERNEARALLEHWGAMQ